jgi:hypothetical protein
MQVHGVVTLKDPSPFSFALPWAHSYPQRTAQSRQPGCHGLTLLLPLPVLRGNRGWAHAKLTMYDDDDDDVWKIFMLLFGMTDLALVCSEW